MSRNMSDTGPQKPMGKPLRPNETLLVRNAKLVDVIEGKLFDEPSLMIRGGKIDGLIKSEDPEGTKADRVIDAEGRYLIPGLINAHCHITLPGIFGPSLSILRHMGKQIDKSCSDSVTHGVTTIRDQLGRQDSILRRMDRIERGELLGPRILRGLVVDVRKGYMDYPKWLFKKAVCIVNNPSEARDAVSRAVDIGADHIKVSLQYHLWMQGEKPINLMTDEMLSAVVEKATSLGTKVAIHQTSVKGFQRALKAGIHSLEHIPNDGLLKDGDIKQFVDRGHYLVPTKSVAWAMMYPLTGDENFQHPMAQFMYNDKVKRIRSFVDEFGHPLMAKAGMTMFKIWNQPGYFDKNHPIMKAPSVRIFNAEAAIGGRNMLAIYKAGGKIGCGNDGGTPYVWPGSLALEMFLLEKSGMKPADILRSATAINAEIIAMEDKLGTLDQGKIADCVFLDGNPLECMESMDKVAAVLQSGRLVHTDGNVTEISS